MAPCPPETYKTTGPGPFLRVRGNGPGGLHHDIHVRCCQHDQTAAHAQPAREKDDMTSKFLRVPTNRTALEIYDASTPNGLDGPVSSRPSRAATSEAPNRWRRHASASAEGFRRQMSSQGTTSVSPCRSRSSVRSIRRWNSRSGNGHTALPDGDDPVRKHRVRSMTIKRADQ